MSLWENVLKTVTGIKSGNWVLIPATQHERRVNRLSQTLLRHKMCVFHEGCVMTTNVDEVRGKILRLVCCVVGTDRHRNMWISYTMCVCDEGELQKSAILIFFWMVLVLHYTNPQHYWFLLKTTNGPRTQLTHWNRRFIFSKYNLQLAVIIPPQQVSIHLSLIATSGTWSANFAPALWTVVRSFFALKELKNQRKWKFLIVRKMHQTIRNISLTRSQSMDSVEDTISHKIHLHPNIQTEAKRVEGRRKIGLCTKSKYRHQCPWPSA